MKFEMPIAEVMEFDVKDVLTASTNNESGATGTEPVTTMDRGREDGVIHPLDPTYVCDGTQADNGFARPCA